MSDTGMDKIFLAEENAELKRMLSQIRHDIAEAVDEIDEDYDSALETLKAIAKRDPDRRDSKVGQKGKRRG